MALMARKPHHLLMNRRFDMKTLVALIAFVPLLAFAGGEMKKVCHVDAKTKKEVCKTIKVHKKLEGKKVPGQK
jgi:hypothetical protein